MFNHYETVGFGLEMGGLGYSLYSEGGSLTVSGFGLILNGIGVGGNSLIDLYDGRMGAGAIRVAKFGFFFGLGKGVNAASYGVVDKFLMESFSLFYDNFVSDKMINTMVDSRTLFTPIEYEFNVRYDAVRKN